jgi:hypothetical protein
LCSSAQLAASGFLGTLFLGAAKVLDAGDFNFSVLRTAGFLASSITQPLMDHSSIALKFTAKRGAPISNHGHGLVYGMPRVYALVGAKRLLHICNMPGALDP